MTDTPVLDRVERWLEEFRPRTPREFVALQIAKRFNDTHELARYVNAAQVFPKNVLLEAARRATARAEETGEPAPKHLFELLRQLAEEGRP